jgi:hypothetical protein
MMGTKYNHLWMDSENSHVFNKIHGPKKKYSRVQEIFMILKSINFTKKSYSV